MKIEMPKVKPAELLLAVIVSAILQPPISALLNWSWVILTSGTAGILASIRDSFIRRAAQHLDHVPSIGDDWIFRVVGGLCIYAVFWTSKALVAELKARQKDIKHIVSYAAGLTVLVCFTGLTFFDKSMTSASAELWAQFEQSVQALAPKLTDAEVKDLRSEFAQMSNADDLKSLRAKVKLLSNSAAIKLNTFSK